MSEFESTASVSLKTLRLGLLVAGLVIFAGVFWVFRKPAPVASITTHSPSALTERPSTQSSTDTKQPAESTTSGDAQPDQLDPAQWRMGNQPIEVEVSDVSQELSMADQLLADGQLYSSDQDGALGRYAGILRAHPEHPEALEGFDSVVSLLMETLRQHAQRREIAAGAKIYQALRRAGVQHANLTQLGDRLEALEKSANLMARAEADLQAGRLIDPAGRSALDRLRRATQLDPSSTALADRLVGLERRLIEEALSAARDRNFGQARRLLDGAQRARGGSSAVVYAVEQVAQFRQGQIDQSSDAARAAMRDSRFPDAEQAIASVQNLGADSPLLAELTEELRLSRLYSIYRPAQRFTDALANGRPGPTMMVLPHGEFLMGAQENKGQENRVERPAHEVRFQRGFAMAEHEVSVAMFGQFIQSSGYRTDAERQGYSLAYSERTGRVGRLPKTHWRHAYNGRDAEPEMPVVHVSFSDARAFARWLSDQTQAPYRLPSEAEFEYALRGGEPSRYWWGDGTPDLAVENLTGEGDVSVRELTWTAAFDNYSDGFWGPAPVASLVANPFGLYDMTGNVQEWVADCWHDTYVRAPSDGSAWVNRGCDLRVVRGTFWGGAPDTARASSRHGYQSNTRGASIGFRVARDLVVTLPQMAGG
ncbi:MAG: formylglycine-generating enzyme family protein [Lysobacterales bacterium]